MSGKKYGVEDCFCDVKVWRKRKEWRFSLRAMTFLLKKEIMKIQVEREVTEDEGVVIVG